jgi:3-hydroxyacyl-CoA dehydrogenase
MELVELVFPARASEATRERARAFCEALGKTAIEVPDLPGFVVNSLLFPFLFGAVVLLEQTGIAPQDLDDCLRLGAGHAIGPLAVLDLVGLDVSIAIGERIGADVPPLLHELVAAGKLGRKTGVGFHTY